MRCNIRRRAGLSVLTLWRLRLQYCTTLARGSHGSHSQHRGIGAVLVKTLMALEWPKPIAHQPGRRGIEVEEMMIHGTLKALGSCAVTTIVQRLRGHTAAIILPAALPNPPMT